MRNAQASREITLRVFLFSTLPPLISLRGTKPSQGRKMMFGRPRAHVQPGLDDHGLHRHHLDAVQCGSDPRPPRASTRCQIEIRLVLRGLFALAFAALPGHWRWRRLHRFDFRRRQLFHPRLQVPVASRHLTLHMIPVG